MKDGRGAFMVAVKNANKELVREYIRSHNGCLRIEISRDLNMSPITVRRHIATIEDEKTKEPA